MTSRVKVVYALLAAVWVGLIAWQTVEHIKVKEAAKSALLRRPLVITHTVEAVLLATTRFQFVTRERLEPVMTQLLDTREMQAVALLNAAGEIVAAAGTAPDIHGEGTIWGATNVTVISQIDLGVNNTRTNSEGMTEPAMLVLPRSEAPGGGGPRPPMRDGTNTLSITNIPVPAVVSLTNIVGGELANSSRTNNAGRMETNTDGRGIVVSGERPQNQRGRRGPPPIDPEIRKRSTPHSLAIVLSTLNFQKANERDLWMRVIIGFFGTIGLVGFALAWQNLEKSSELQMRLLRASELNSHLKAMNVAAAGLAHETRNPLNIISGLAQLIAREKDASQEVRKKSREILDETERVTGQLNEFINYSRPREVRRTPVALNTLADEIVRALSYDIDEKKIAVHVDVPPMVIQADEQLFRQTLFNLVLNAVQAVDTLGQIEIRARQSGGEVSVEVSDNGPGVPASQRADIFKPYFTTHQKGTGLGLAVVQQIVLAHGWEIEVLSNEPKGAIFRIRRLKLANKN